MGTIKIKDAEGNWVGLPNYGIQQFPDAPTDGKIYGRKDKSWTEVKGDNALDISWIFNALDPSKESKVTKDQLILIEKAFNNHVSIAYATEGNDTQTFFIQISKNSTDSQYILSLQQSVAELDRILLGIYTFIIHSDTLIIEPYANSSQLVNNGTGDKFLADNGKYQTPTTSDWIDKVSISMDYSVTPALAPLKVNPNAKYQILINDVLIKLNNNTGHDLVLDASLGMKVMVELFLDGSWKGYVNYPSKTTITNGEVYVFNTSRATSVSVSGKNFDTTDYISFIPVRARITLKDINGNEFEYCTDVKKIPLCKSTVNFYLREQGVVISKDYYDLLGSSTSSDNILYLITE